MIKLFESILLFAVFFFFALSSDFVYAWNSTAEMLEVPDTNASVRRYSDHIKVCQVGYLVDESKIAILTAEPKGQVVVRKSDNDESVALGLAHTGRVITAAALIMAISFAALIAAQVAVMRLFGTGLTLAILVDATLVRLVLVPAFMHVAGRWNWWAPRPLVRLHSRLGISEGGPRSADGPI